MISAIRNCFKFQCSTKWMWVSILKLVNIWPNCLKIVNNVMKFYIYLWGYIFVPFIQINLHYFNTDLSCLQVCFLAGPSNLSCQEKPTFYQLVFLWSLSIKSLILYIYRTFRNEWNYHIFYGSSSPVFALFCIAIYCLV